MTRHDDTAALVEAIGTGEHIYHHHADRFVVSLVVSYNPDADGVHTPQEAARAALDLTKDSGAAGTHWVVYDRLTERSHLLQQDDFDH